MAMLSGLTDRTIEELRSISEANDGTEIDARVGALCGLMQQTATRLCPAAAAAAMDAALSLLSALQAARLRLPTSASAAAALDRSVQQLLRVLQQGLAPPTPALLPPAAAAAAPQPATDGGSRRAELASLVRGLGFSGHDWQAAQAALCQRTAAALGAGPPGSGSGPAAAAAADAAHVKPSSVTSPLDSLLRTTVGSPAWQPGSGEPSQLHGTIAELLWVLRQFPSPADLPPERQPQLSPEGWAAYWVLEPRALQQALAEILQAATQQLAAGQQKGAGPRRQQAAAVGSAPSGTSGWLPDVQKLLGTKPHWAATTAAVAQHPALHLLARQTLHSWLAASGNPAAWRLLLHFVQAATGYSSAAQSRQQQGLLPLQLRVLYPVGLAGAAALLHTQSPTETGLCQAVWLLQRFLSGEASESASRGQAAAEPTAGGVAVAWPPTVAAVTAGPHGVAGDPAAWAVAAAERWQQAWQLQLDCPSWLLFCLQQLPLEQLLHLAAQQAGEDGHPGSGAAGPATPLGAVAQRVQHVNPVPGGSQVTNDSAPSAQQLPAAYAAASPAAARYAALALWPGEPLNQAVLEEALQLQVEDVDLAAVRPWLQALHSWQVMLATAAPAEAGCGIDAAAAVLQQEPPEEGKPAAAQARAAAAAVEMVEAEDDML